MLSLLLQSTKTLEISARVESTYLLYLQEYVIPYVIGDPEPFSELNFYFLPSSHAIGGRLAVVVLVVAV